MDKARQVLQETPQERETRSAGAFPLIERQLPALISRRNYPLVDTLTSYLGLHNPFSQPINPKTETVWLLDNTAYRPSSLNPFRTQPWHAEFVVAYFLRNSGRDITSIVADIADKVGLSQNSDGKVREDGERTIRERLQPFLDGIRPARTVSVKFPGGNQVRKLGPSGRNGLSSQVVPVPGEYRDGQRAEIQAVPEGVGSLGGMTTYFAEPEGWAVISGRSNPALA